MEKPSRPLQNLYIIFIASVVIIIVASQGIIQYDLNRQDSDASLINMAGRQRMLSQRISKLALFFYYNSTEKKPRGHYHVDSLRKLVGDWERIHFQLIKQNHDGTNSKAIDSLLNNNTSNVKVVVAACSEILRNQEQINIRASIDKISGIELNYLMRMEKTVATYQKEAETRLKTLKRLELILSALAIIILTCEFIFFILPVLRQLHVKNQKLTESNAILAASEEEIRSSLEQISTLQADLEEKTRQYYRLIDGASDMIYEIDSDGKFLFVNPVLETITGYGKDELIGHPSRELIYGADFEELKNFYKQQRERREEVSYLEFRAKTKSGKVIWVGQNARMVFNGSAIYKVSIVARDITKIKEAEAGLMRQSILFRTIIDNIPINIYAKNTRSEKILANKAEYEYMGAKSENEILGKSDVDLYPEESAVVSLAEDKRILAGETMINVETFNTRKDGSETWFLVSKVPLKDDQGKIIGLVGISNNITERKLAQEEIARKERLYRLVSENSQDVISLHDLDGKFVYISPACIGLHGYTPDELIGKNGLEFVHPEDVEMINRSSPDVMARMEKGETIEPSQFRIVTRNRGIIWVENAMKPVFENGVMTGFQSTVRDISMRKAYETALHAAKEKAEEATIAKTQFLSMMSHEIRTPMNGIIGLTNILIDDEPKLEQVDNLNLLKFSCDNLLTIINDILDFSKVESGKMQLEEIPYNLTDTIQQYVKLSNDRAEKKGIALKLSLDSNLPKFVIGDPVRLGQIINNLISNAVKFTEQGFVEVSVKKIDVSGDVNRIRIFVKDTGIGIPEDKIESIFEGFNQAATDTTRKFGGTGLGLSISKKLLKLMGSEINVVSKVGEGSDFSFDLLLSEVHSPVSSKVEKKEEVNGIPKGLKLLLVEDNPVNQLVAKNFLAKWGFDITIAGDGKIAVKEITSKQFDLVLMDIHMPIMDGYQASREIRAMEDKYFTSVPIIALTADVSPEIQRRATTAGMNDIISKPFKPAELQKMLEKFVSPTKEDELIFEVSSIDAFPKLKSFTGGDAVFEAELKTHFISNINELKLEISGVESTNNYEDYERAVHKCRTTLMMIDDINLNHTIESVRESLETKSDKTAKLLEKLTKACDDVIVRLTAK